MSTLRHTWGTRYRFNTSGVLQDSFANVHPDAQIDDSVIVFGDPANLRVGAGSRIDAFCVLSVGTDPAHGVRIGRRTHVGCGCYLFGSSGRITVGDCCSLSPRVTVYTATDLMDDDNLIGPCVPDKAREVERGDVMIEDGSAVFTNAYVSPGAYLGRGVLIGKGKGAVGNYVPGTVVRGSGMKVERDPRLIAEYVERAVREST